MVPNWLHVLAYVWLVLTAISFLIVVFDIPKQQLSMEIMKVVWPLTILYMGPFGLYAYWAWGRVSVVHASHVDHPMDHREMTHHIMDHTPHHPSRHYWQGVFLSSTHCAASCVLGDIIGETLLAMTGFIIAGSSLFTSYIVDFILAYIIGIAFQYFSIVPMQGLTPAEGIRAALKADTVSLIAFEIGMFIWLGIVYVLIPLTPAQPVYWFLMQIAMMVGFATSYPANWVLVQRGIKYAM